MKKLILLFIAITLITVTSCKKDKDNDTQITSTKTFISEGANDGIITNSSPRTLSSYYSGGQGKEITIGWNSSGKAMRGFISFDITSILPASGKVLVIEEAILKVYEANTNMHPFDGDGDRTVSCYLVDYNDLDINDYDGQFISLCGTIASDGYSVLTEHPLTVTSQLKDLIKAYPTSTDKFQFRLQFTSDINVTSGSPLTQSMWNIFSGEETSFSDYRPILDIKYHYEKE